LPTRYSQYTSTAGMAKFKVCARAIYTGNIYNPNLDCQHYNLCPNISLLACENERYKRTIDILYKTNALAFQRLWELEGR
jgi:hypothetical protein